MTEIRRGPEKRGMPRGVWITLVAGSVALAGSLVLTTGDSPPPTYPQPSYSLDLPPIPSYPVNQPTYPVRPVPTEYSAPSQAPQSPVATQPKQPPG